MGGSEKKGLPIGPKCTNFKKFTQFHETKSKLKGGLFYEKKSQLMYLGSLNAGGFEQTRPKWTNFNFFPQFLVQNQISNRVYLVGKFDISCFYLEPFREGSFGYAHACRPAKYGLIKIF